jgi:hypothetical protein
MMQEAWQAHSPFNEVILCPLGGGLARTYPNTMDHSGTGHGRVSTSVFKWRQLPHRDHRCRLSSGLFREHEILWQ